MILFNAPVNHYVTPKFYVETKPATGKVVPTWNYAAVQAYGTATFYTDATSRTTEYLSKQISDLSNLAETNIMGHERPWQVSDAPERYVDLLRKSIIGVEIEITRLEGKFKMSQELAAGDRAGVIDGFKKIDTDAARFVADTVEERGRIKDEGKTMKTAQVAQ
jgi:predicted FMN-binding regulatory protein PaiB